MIRDKAVNRAQAMRDKALSMAMKRKEEFLGARVPKDLRDKVMDRAHGLGIPVSILIRNILEEAFRDQKSAVGMVPGQEVSPRTAQGTERFSAVLGWEMIRLNRQVGCSSCGRQLLPGASVTLGLVFGVVETGATHIILCDQCQGSM